VIPRFTDAIVPFSTSVGKGTTAWPREGERAYEYMLTVADKHAGVWRARFINAEEMPEWESGPDLAQYLAAWGSDDWEAVGMNIENSQMYILFKREVTVVARPAARDANRGLRGLRR
jgi:hypothetical protein